MLKRNPDGSVRWYRAKCKVCVRRRVREYLADPERKAKASARAKRNYTTEKRRIYMLAKKFGMTVEEYRELSASQDDTCAICRRPESAVRNGKPLPLAVDHCHVSESVRGLLCGKCNTLLGLANDDIETLQSAIAYLSRGASLSTH